MASEKTVQREVWLALGPVARLFRCNTGRAWVSGAGPATMRPDGSAVVPSARPIALGLAYPTGDPVVGTPDLIGWTPIVITPEMVGRTVPVFTGIETKASGGGKRREGQINFVGAVQAAGGIAGFASSASQGLEIIDAWRRGDTPDPL